MSKYFYRVEHKKSKLGPYTHEFSENSEEYKILDEKYGSTLVSLALKTFNVDVYNTRTHPGPKRDIPHIGHFDIEDLKFGFRGPVQLFKWFSRKKEVFKFLKKFGFQIVRYNCKEGSRLDGKTHSCIKINELSKGKIMTDEWIEKYLTN
jgi:hypothetical protein